MNAAPSSTIQSSTIARAHGLTVLITGTSSGFGQLLGRSLLARGHRVFGASRQPSPAAGDAPRLQLDVRDAASVTACVDEVRRMAGPIDVLVNNAGYVHEGPLEELPIEDMQAIFETNFFGAVRMTTAVLPDMRTRRFGRIINVTSLAGLIPLPYLGPYCASKHALESYSESLRHELLPLGVSVAIVEPGYFNTGIATRKLRTSARIADYDPHRRRMYEVFARDEDRAKGPEPVVDLLTRLVEGRRKGLRHVIGPDAMMYRLRGFIPQALWERGMRLTLGLDGR
jgi:NAD(P)-dependent dehydrogenase (short-subunit alcohol dehydrogenase family)